VLELSNQSNWVAGLYPGWDHAQQYQLTAVFKAGFSFDESGQVTPLPADYNIVESDEHHANPLTSSLVQASEIAPFKQGSEIYLYGTAIPERDNLIAMEVGMGLSLSDGREWKKILRVFGPRKWQKTKVNYIMGKPGSVQAIPLQYEYAFGGCNPNNDDDAYAANPIGIGYNSDQRKLVSDELPRIETGPTYVTSPMHKPVPAGFAPLPVFWEPRRSEIGEPVADPFAQGGCPYDRAAQKSLHNAAPHDQRFDKPFIGGEVLHLRALLANVSHKRSVQIKLPKLQPQLYTIIDNKAELLSPACDTVVVNTDEQTVFMIFRAGIPWRMTDRRKGWVVLKDLEILELPYVKEGRDAPRMAS
jgi:hypothetical protein